MELKAYILYLLESNANDFDASVELDTNFYSEDMIDIEFFWNIINKFNHKNICIIFKNILLNYIYPIPKDIAHYLIKNDIAKDYLLHSKAEQKIEILEVLANEKKDEAVIKISTKYYLDNTIDIKIFEQFIIDHKESTFMLENLAYLYSNNSEKKNIYIKICQKLGLNNIIKILDETDKVEYALNINDEAEIYFLFSVGTPKVLQSLAKNINTPVEILKKMLGIKNIKYASTIRLLARNNLDNRVY